MFENMRLENIIRPALSLIIFFGVVFSIHRVVLGSTQLVKLPVAPALSGQISQALGPDPNGSLLVVSKDYTLTPHYFSEPDWAIANVQPIDSSSKLQNGYVIMKKNNGIFQVVFGPGTSIASTQLTSLPPDVAGYLNAHVAIYTPIVGQ